MTELSPLDQVTKHLSPLQDIQQKDAKISEIPLVTNCIIFIKIPREAKLSPPRETFMEVKDETFLENT